VQSNGKNQLNKSNPEWTSIIAVLSQNWNTPRYRGTMKLGRRALLWMPVTNRRKKKKTQDTKEDQKHKREKTKNKEKKRNKAASRVDNSPPPRPYPQEKISGKTPKLMEKFLNWKISLSQLLLWLKIS